VGHPAEEVGFPPQLIKEVYLRVVGAEITKEVTHGPAILDLACRAECSAERIDRAIKEINQWM
jgi:hypothetical protein